MKSRQQEPEQCPTCGEQSLFFRTWSTHHKTGNRFYPIRVQSLRWCANRDCPDNIRKAA
jgi:hypothetical protein